MVTVTKTSGADSTIKANDASYFGNALMISKDGLNIIVGGRDGTGYGLARVYKFSSNAWSQKGQNLTVTTAGSSGSRNGFAVAINHDGSIIAVSQQYNSYNTGQVTVYTFSSNTWSKLGNSISPNEYNAGFGFSVAMNYDGYIIAVQDLSLIHI